MTNEQIAREFLKRFFGVTEVDVLELAAMLDSAQEDGRATTEWERLEPTAKHVYFDAGDVILSAGPRRQRCRVCRGRGHQFGKLRPAETCANCAGKGFRFVKLEGPP